MDLSKEPDKVNVSGTWYFKPPLLDKEASVEEKEEYNFALLAWRLVLRKSTWGFEKNLEKKQKIRLSSLAGGQVRRVRMKNAFVEPVDYLTVFEKNNWICQLCNRPVSKLRDKRLVDIASLDHIIPISKGGEHSYANTQLAHLSCNLIKGASTPKL